GVENALDIGTELLSLGKHGVELMLAEHGPQRGLRKHVGSRKIVLDVDNRPLGIDDIEIQHGIDLHRDVVARDDVLARDLDDLNAQIDPYHLLKEGDQQDEARSPDPLEAPKGKDDGTFILAQNLHRHENHNKSRQDQNRDDIEKHWVAPFRPSG